MKNAVLVFQCSACEADTTVRCRQCGKPVCPRHRWGTGALSEGYICSGTCALPDFGGFSGVQRIPPLEKGEKSLITLAIIGIVAVVTFLAIYLLVEQPWHG